jgi:hypothetical protein
MTKITSNNKDQYTPIEFGNTHRRIKYQIEFYVDAYEMSESGEITYYIRKERKVNR